MEQIKEMVEEYVVNNTADLQLFSLMQAMNSLGFDLMRTNKGGLVFFNPSRACKGANLFSVGRAIALHNNLTHMNNFGYDSYFVNQFLAAKVVKRVKLQYSKKTKVLAINGTGNAHLVQVVDPTYLTLFNVLSPMEIQEE